MSEKEIRDAIKAIEEIIERKTMIGEKCPTCGMVQPVITTDVANLQGKEHLLGVLRGLQSVLGEGELPTLEDYRYSYFP